MKRMRGLLVLTILCFLISSVTSLQAWEILQQSGFSQALGDIFFIDEQKGWATGYQGVIIHTQDGGKTWSQQKVELPCDSELYNIYFADDKHGWVTGSYVMGDGFILNTSNGGETWKIFKTKDMEMPYSISFIDNKKGWVCGFGNGTILHTEDGGKTWDVLYKPEKNYLWRQIFFENAQKGWVIGCESPQKGKFFDTIMATKDGGKTWQVKYYKPVADEDWWYPWSSIWFVNEQEGWATICKKEATLLYTKDGGETWTKHQFNLGSWLYSVKFINQKEGFISGNLADSGKGALFHTKDGGISWELTAEFSKSLRKIHFLNSQEGWVTRSNGYFYHTINGGKDWECQLEPKTHLHDICFVDRNNGWAFGKYERGGGLILHSEDGGRNWDKQRLELPSGDWQMGIHFMDSQHGWTGVSILGPNSTGAFLQTKDGSKNWSITEIEYLPQDIHFSDAQNGLMIAEIEGGPLVMSFVQTNDGGESWQVRNKVARDKELGGRRIPSRIQCLNAQQWWVMSSWCLSYTSNNGKNWTQKKVPDTSGFYFLDDQIGWFGSNRLYHTKNGCQDYKEQELPMPIEWISDIYFKDSQEGWCLGNRYYVGDSLERCIIFHTTNGGETWEVDLKSPQHLHRFGYASGRLWAVGDNSVVYGIATQAVSALGKQYITLGKVKTVLFQNYPNPFNPETWIPYQIAQDSDVTITIHNIKGETIRTLQPGRQRAGAYILKKQAVYWDGKDDKGEEVASGVYFYTLRTSDFSTSRKMVIFK
ncbi:T9SS type A sorting domain-containing protein [Candidatus Poribacteria bacterium]|nr:T9SS type A sorting domain-containing protein [Candidatus Poribacteria bacterium]